MPVVKQPTNRYSLNEPDGHPHPRPEFVFPFVERYFEWVAAFDEGTSLMCRWIDFTYTQLVQRPNTCLLHRRTVLQKENTRNTST